MYTLGISAQSQAYIIIAQYIWYAILSLISIVTPISAQNINSSA